MNSKCIQNDWMINDECEVFVKLVAKRRWAKGIVTGKFKNATGEWLLVNYHNSFTITVNLNQGLVRKPVDKQQPIFAVRSIVESGSQFCWCCGKQWRYGHVCDDSFRFELVSLLNKATSKSIGAVNGVPSMRACPQCCQLITHTDACKHMKCAACKTDFCFVCLKPKVNGNWSCGSHSDRCPVAPKQNLQTLPNAVVMNKKSFYLY